MNLLAQTLEKILALPEWDGESEGDYWEQNDYFNDMDCGTCGCFAGWAIHLAEPEVFSVDTFITHFPFDGIFGNAVEDVAAKLLGITEEQAKKLFLPSNTLADLERICNEITNSATED